MKCTNCGKEIANDSVFCEYCGAKTNRPSEINPTIDSIILNIIEIGAHQKGTFASYKARRKCYKLYKQATNLPNYKEHVQKLQLDYFPDEHYKSIVEQRYYRWLLWGIIWGIICGATIFGLVITILLIWKIIKEAKICKQKIKEIQDKKNM